MEKKKCTEEKKNRKIKKIILASTIAAVVLIIAFITIPRATGGNEKVSFQKIEESRIPANITSDVIPEYKTLERALACVVDDDVYVLVTRGEKPSSGFGVDIDRMVLEEKEDKTNLIVYAEFDDPDKETPVSQIITYPMCIVKTDLNRLPNTIELRIQY